MYSIGEFSQITSLTVRTLRFYHEKQLLVPAAVDPATGYRSYDDRNVDRARVIAALRDLEFPLDDVAAILENCAEDEDLTAFLDSHRMSLAERIGQLAGAVRQIDRLIREQRPARDEQVLSPQELDIEEREIEPVLIAGMRMQGRYSDCGKRFADLGKRVGRYIAGKPLCLYYDGEYRDDDATFEPCFPIRQAVQAEGVDVRELPRSRCVVAIHRGPYEQLGHTYQRALRYAKERALAVSLPTREAYLKGPGMIFRGKPERYLTEIQLPVESL